MKSNGQTQWLPMQKGTKKWSQRVQWGRPTDKMRKSIKKTRSKKRNEGVPSQRDN